MDYRGDPDARPSHVHTSALHSSPSVESGVAEELPGRNNLKLLLPKSLKDIEGALHNIDDIRSTPHGNATFNLRAAVRAAAGGIGDRGRAGDGIGRDRDRDRNQRYAAAVVVST